MNGAGPLALCDTSCSAFLCIPHYQPTPALTTLLRAFPLCVEAKLLFGGGTDRKLYCSYRDTGLEKKEEECNRVVLQYKTGAVR